MSNPLIVCNPISNACHPNAGSAIFLPPCATASSGIAIAVSDDPWNRLVNSPWSAAERERINRAYSERAKGVEFPVVYSIDVHPGMMISVGTSSKQGSMSGIQIQSHQFNMKCPRHFEIHRVTYSDTAGNPKERLLLALHRDFVSEDGCLKVQIDEHTYSLNNRPSLEKGTAELPKAKPICEEDKSSKREPDTTPSKTPNESSPKSSPTTVPNEVDIDALARKVDVLTERLETLVRERSLHQQELDRQWQQTKAIFDYSMEQAGCTRSVVEKLRREGVWYLAQREAGKTEGWRHLYFKLERRGGFKISFCESNEVPVEEMIWTTLGRDWQSEAIRVSGAKETRFSDIVNYGFTTDTLRLVDRLARISSSPENKE